MNNFNFNPGRRPYRPGWGNNYPHRPPHRPPYRPGYGNQGFFGNWGLPFIGGAVLGSIIGSSNNQPVYVYPQYPYPYYVGY